MTNTDYIIIVLFSLMILLIGLSFSKTSGSGMKSFFAAGGSVPWWINSLSLFMGFVSAGTFVVWGSIAYTSGWVSISIQWTMAIAGFIVGFFIAPRWHKTKALTAAEFIAARLGTGIQKVYSYIYLCIMVFMTGVYLYSVSRILEVSTGISLYILIGSLGLIVMAYTTLGGLWAVIVTDTLQFVILTAAAIVVVPLSFDRVGGLQKFITSVPSEGFLALTNHEYVWSFLLGFGLYNLFFLGGQWGYVQRYTSVATTKEAKKVGWLFGLLYIISPVIWMIPPMVYRVINPDLVGLQDEGAYLMMCKEVLPAGMLGLMLISLVFATNSSVQGVLNISAGVVTNDFYKVRNPNSTDKQLMKVAKLSSIIFGGITIVIAMLVPFLGGAKEVVLSVAATTGCPLYLPLIWSLFSPRQSGKTILSISIISLVITLFIKMGGSYFLGLTISRSSEMLLGVFLPASLLILSEIYAVNRVRSFGDEHLCGVGVSPAEPESMSPPTNVSAENKKGVKAISLGIVFTGVMMIGIGFTAEAGKMYVLSMAGLLVALGVFFLIKTNK